MIDEQTPTSQVEEALASANVAHDEDPDPTNVEGRMPQKLTGREVKRVVVKISGSPSLLEIEGDDVDLGTDLKIRYQHQLVAEFRRDAVDGWWYKSFVLNDGPPYGGEGDAGDVGDVSAEGRGGATPA